MTTNHPSVFGSPVVPAAGGLQGKALPLLDTQETTDTSQKNATYRAFLVSGIQPAVNLAYSVYASIDQRDNTKRRLAYSECRARAWFVRNIRTSEVRVSSQRCHLRWCPLCIRTKTFIITQSVIPWLKARPKAKFITLTLKHSTDDLKPQIDRLYNGFRKLRRRKWFSNLTKGGIWFFQIKKGKKDGLWHPHIHTLVDADFVPQKKLSAAWLEITGDSYICDVRPIKDVKVAAEYVARYAAAPCRLSDFDKNLAIEVVDSLHGRRICGTWGTGSEIALAGSPPEDAEDWQHVGSWAWVLENRRSDAYCQEIMDGFLTGAPVSPPPLPPPKFIDDSIEDINTIFRREQAFWREFYEFSKANRNSCLAVSKKGKQEKPFNWRQVVAETNMLWV